MSKTQINIQIRSAAGGDDTRTLTITPDAHGCTIEIDGTEESIVLNYSIGQLRAYLCDANGNCENPPSIIIQTR